MRPKWKPLYVNLIMILMRYISLIDWGSIPGLGSEIVFLRIELDERSSVISKFLIPSSLLAFSLIYEEEASVYWLVIT